MSCEQDSGETAYLCSIQSELGQLDCGWRIHLQGGSLT